MSYRRLLVIDSERNREFFDKLRIQPLFERLKITKCKWVSPSMGWVALNCHGSLKEHLGGIGGLLRDGEGKIIVGFAGGVHPYFIYALEDLAIEQGLKLAIEHHCMKVQVYSDSLQAVEVVKGTQPTPWVVKNSMRRIKAYGSRLEDWRIDHVYREVNIIRSDFIISLSDD